MDLDKRVLFIVMMIIVLFQHMNVNCSLYDLLIIREFVLMILQAE